MPANTASGYYTASLSSRTAACRRCRAARDAPARRFDLRPYAVRDLPPVLKIFCGLNKIGSHTPPFAYVGLEEGRMRHDTAWVAPIGASQTINSRRWAVLTSAAAALAAAVRSVGRPSSARLRLPPHILPRLASMRAAVTRRGCRARCRLPSLCRQTRSASVLPERASDCHSARPATALATATRSRLSVSDVFRPQQRTHSLAGIQRRQRAWRSLPPLETARI